MPLESRPSLRARLSTFDNFNWSGTGFLLDDGRLVTAGHVIKPWLFGVSDDDTAKMHA